MKAESLSKTPEGTETSSGLRPHRSTVDGELRAILDASRAVASAVPLSDALISIAKTAASQVRAQSAAILIADPHGRTHLASSYGLSASLRAILAGGNSTKSPVRSVTRRLADRLVIADTEKEEVWTSWLQVSRQGGYRAFVMLPLVLDSRSHGYLVVYRTAPGSWSSDELCRLNRISSHAASAVRTRRLIDGQEHQLTALALAARGLREQNREHVMHLETISSLLERGETADAHGFLVELGNELHDEQFLVAERVHNRILAGLLLAEMAVARQRGIRFRIVPRGQIDRLPVRLTEAAAVSIVGNLLDNAFDAVAEMPLLRRRVALLLTQDANETVVRVRDWGTGFGDRSDADLLRPGFTTKRGQRGMGLALVARLVASTGGSIRIERLRVGAALTVVIPNI